VPGCPAALALPMPSLPRQPAPVPDAGGTLRGETPAPVPGDALSLSGTRPVPGTGVSDVKFAVPRLQVDKREWKTWRQLEEDSFTTTASRPKAKRTQSPTSDTEIQILNRRALATLSYSKGCPARPVQQPRFLGVRSTVGASLEMPPAHPEIRKGSSSPVLAPPAERHCQTPQGSGARLQPHQHGRRFSPCHRCGSARADGTSLVLSRQLPQHAEKLQTEAKLLCSTFQAAILKPSPQNQLGLQDSPCVVGLSLLCASKCEVPAEQEPGNSSGSRMPPSPATGSQETAEKDVNALKQDSS